MASQKFFALPVFNTTTPSSAGAAGATTFARPPTGNFVNTLMPADATVEIYNDVEWFLSADEP